jgi:hypothetical protein
VPAAMTWSQPGHRYSFVDDAPGTERTTQSPSGPDSARVTAAERNGTWSGRGGRFERGTAPFSATAIPPSGTPRLRLRHSCHAGTDHERRR